ncbi:hypothetical protein REPUB_Repub10bG0142500 [Reevesia pubescens]
MAMISWIKPGLHVVNLNVDGSFRTCYGVDVAGGLLPDEKGVWLMGFIYIVGICDILAAELWSIYQGGYRNVEVETDSLLAVRTIHASIRKHDAIEMLIEAIRELMKRD